MATRWHSFSTQTVQPAQRLHHWNDYGSETLGDLTVDPADRLGFSATLSRAELGPLGLVTMTSTAANACSGGGTGLWQGAERDAVLVAIPERGTGHCRQNNGISTTVKPGDLFFRDLTRFWSHECHEAMQILMIKIPFAVLLTRMEDPGRLLGRTFSSDRPAVKMASDIIRSVHRTLVAEPDGDWDAALADLVLDSVHILYRSFETGELAPAGWHDRAAMRRNAMSWILRRLDDPELSVAAVAQGLGLGTRSLQRAFVEGGETVSQFIHNQRLDRAARLFAGAETTSARSILDVALSVGFNDASHFSRSFSRRYGVAPRAYRGGAPLVD